MKNLIVNLLLNGLAVYIAAFLLSGVVVSGFVSAIIVSIVLALINTFVKPLFTILTIPITAFTFGIFLFFINGLMVLLAAYLLDGFRVDNIIWAMMFSCIVSLLNSLFGSSQS